MMLNACVYIDLQSNASSILPAVTDANSIKGTNPKELRRKKKSNNLQCWITSDYVLNVKEKKTDEKRLFMQKHTCAVHHGPNCTIFHRFVFR